MDISALFHNALTTDGGDHGHDHAHDYKVPAKVLKADYQAKAAQVGGEAKAICNDGTKSDAVKVQGGCSHHRGVDATVIVLESKNDKPQK